MEIKRIKITTQRAIPLGYQGENAVVQIVFPQPENLLSGQWTLMHQRAIDGEAYPVPLAVEADGLAWTVTSGDTAVSGLGRAQLICTGADGEILKTAVYSTVTIKSLAVGEEPPDPVKPWYDAIMEEIEQIGGIDPEDIEAAIEAYMAEHPVVETDPTVADWAKQPEKPTYTAEEVGAAPPALHVNHRGLKLSHTFEEILAAYESGAYVDFMGADGYTYYPYIITSYQAYFRNFSASDTQVNTPSARITPNGDVDYIHASCVPVMSVNGKTGAVNLTAADVGALPAGYTPPEAPVQSVNGQTGAVTLEIPTDAHIIDLINRAIAQIPNAAEVAY